MVGSVEGGLALPRGATFGETWGVELGDGYRPQRTPSGASDRPPYSSGGALGLALVSSSSIKEVLLQEGCVLCS